MGRALNAEIREADMAARYGGDEFAVLLDQADEADAHMFLDRVRNRIRATVLTENSAATLTWSTGISMFDASLSPPNAWLAQADAASYKVKERERGGVGLAQNEGEA